jgi:HTH-type transcriptional regulator / antitoxin HigA
MDIRPIRTNDNHRAALADIEACWGAPEGTEEGDKLDLLLALVELYEAKRWPIDIDENFDPVDVLHYAIDEFGHTRRELAELACVGDPVAAACPHRRDDPQDRRSVENPG